MNKPLTRNGDCFGGRTLAELDNFIAEEHRLNEQMRIQASAAPKKNSSTQATPVESADVAFDRLVSGIDTSGATDLNDLIMREIS